MSHEFNTQQDRNEKLKLTWVPRPTQPRNGYQVKSPGKVKGCDIISPTECQLVYQNLCASPICPIRLSLGKHPVQNQLTDHVIPNGMGTYVSTGHVPSGRGTICLHRPCLAKWSGNSCLHRPFVVPSGMETHVSTDLVPCQVEWEAMSPQSLCQVEYEAISPQSLCQVEWELVSTDSGP